ncbi:ATP-binding cassette domain-containing protein [Saccharospirillum impatiens]|uniref:ATP-binding cassette domain-containing protein n=1 Tax=Saccharospirillum impatiens TaxID=169438 RepID=UPI00040CAF55|nr:ATP-binding cassette domain-containing protein [Saccharospirillum impatiens]
MSDHLCFTHNLTLQWGSEPLWSDLNVSLPLGLNALVGPNGHGKSALLSVLAGRTVPTSGQVSWSVPFYYQTQLDPLAGPRVAEALGVAHLFDAFTRLENGLATPADLEQVADQWHLPAQWTKQLASAGLDPDLARPVASLSGGQRTRLALCRAFMQTDHCLLLDEPSNHLDRSGRHWLLQSLAAHPGGALIASHDQTLLHDVDRILELRNGHLVEYGGGYELYQAQRDAQLAAQEHKLDHVTGQQRRLHQQQQATLEKAASRRQQGVQQRRSGSQGKLLLDARKNRSEQTQARLSQQQTQRRDALSDERQSAQAELEQLRTQRLSITQPKVSGAVQLHLADLTLPFVTHRPLTWTVHGGERWRVTGANGRGKSLLLKSLVGWVKPVSGEPDVRGSVRYLDQHFSALDPAVSALDNLQRGQPERSASELRTQLASVRLRADQALQPVSTLSGGERLKVALLSLLSHQSPVDLLLLDEPDNHLDLDSKHLLEQALNDYRGTLVVVTHDDAFASRLNLDFELNLDDSGSLHS